MATNKRSDTSSTDSVDVARHALCHSLAGGLCSGATAFQVRFHRTKETPTETWVYSRARDDWRKRDDFSLSGPAIAELFEQCVTLANREYADIWTLRRTDHGDRTDFELKFRHEAIAGHLDDGLEKYLMGCLFLGHHDSGKDSRHRMGFRGQ
jgi:hypothetical protein